MQSVVRGQKNYLSFKLDLEYNNVITLQFSKCGCTPITVTPEERTQDCNKVITFCIDVFCNFSIGIWEVELFHNDQVIKNEYIKVNYGESFRVDYS